MPTVLFSPPPIDVSVPKFVCPEPMVSLVLPEIPPRTSKMVSEPDIIREPVIDESPSLLPSHSPVGRPVNPAPLPTNEPLKVEPEIVPSTSRLFINV